MKHLSHAQTSTLVIKMNIVGIFARSYIEALTIALHPLARPVPANRKEPAPSRASTDVKILPRAA